MQQQKVLKFGLFASLSALMAALILTEDERSPLTFEEIEEAIRPAVAKTTRRKPAVLGRATPAPVSAESGAESSSGGASLPPPAIAPSRFPASGDVLVVIEQLDQLRTCLSTGSCPYEESDEDPRALSFAVAGALQEGLARLADLHATEGAASGKIEEAARSLLSYENDRVRESALELLGRFEPSQSNLKAIVEGVKDSVDIDVHRRAMVEFRRYSDAGSRRRITDHLIEVLVSGGHHVAQEVAQDLGEVLDSGNLERFQQVLTQLPQDTAKHRLLKSTIEEYRRAQIGG